MKNNYKIIEINVKVLKDNKLVPAIHFQVHKESNGEWLPIAHPQSWGYKLVSRELAEEQVVTYDNSL